MRRVRRSLRAAGIRAAKRVPRGCRALRRAVAAPTQLGHSGADSSNVRLAMHPRHGTAAVALPDEDTLVLYDARSDEIDRRRVLFPLHPALAYSPGGARLAVGLAGRRLLVLGGADDPGRELPLPEEAQAVAFVDEDDLAVVGHLGTLLRVDLELGEAAALQRGWTNGHELRTGELWMYAGAGRAGPARPLSVLAQARQPARRH